MPRSTKTKPFKAALYLTTPESRAELLSDAFASQDLAYVSAALNSITSAYGIETLSRDAGIERDDLVAAISENEHLAPEQAEKLLALLAN